MGKKQEEQWKQRLKELKAYKQKHGDCLVPQNYKHNRKLGNWVDTQRVQYKKRLNGVNSWITQERIDQLNEIDFEWEVGRTKKPDDTLWKKRFKELIKYKKKHGDCCVSTLDKHNRKLGRWVSTQRQEYKKWLRGVNACITQERIDQLNEIDFVWDARFERKSRESDKSTQEGSIPSAGRRNAVASTKTEFNRPRKRRIPSKDRPRKRQRRRQSQDVVRELSPSERKARRRLVLRALYNCRNPIQPDEVVSV